MSVSFLSSLSHLSECEKIKSELYSYSFILTWYNPVIISQCYLFCYNNNVRIHVISYLHFIGYFEFTG